MNNNSLYPLLFLVGIICVCFFVVKMKEDKINEKYNQPFSQNPERELIEIKASTFSNEQKFNEVVDLVSRTPISESQAMEYYISLRDSYVINELSYSSRHGDLMLDFIFKSKSVEYYLDDEKNADMDLFALKFFQLCKEIYLGNGDLKSPSIQDKFNELDEIL